MGAGDWDAAADWNEQSGRTPTPQPGRRMVEVICCSLCQGVDIRRCGQPAGESFTRWQCVTCNNRWKEPPGVGSGRAVLP